MAVGVSGDKCLAQTDLAAGNNESGNIDTLTDRERSAMDVVHEYAAVKKEHPEVVEHLEELDEELDSLLSDENVRLTEAQKAELQTVKQELAEKFDSDTAELVMNYLINSLTQTTVGTGLSGLFAGLMGTAEASTVAGGIVMAVSMGLAMFAQTMADHYSDETESGAELEGLAQSGEVE